MTVRPFKTVKILLACGCTLRRRDAPIHDSQTFLCESGMGHGYKQKAWKSWTFGESSGFNRKFAEPEEPE
jgi:hypothetical protein